MPSQDERPVTLPVVAASIPALLRQTARWVGWSWVWNGKKWDKPPFGVRGGMGSSTNPATWSSFEEVFAAYEEGRFDGLGFVLGPDAASGLHFSGLDIDNCVKDGEVDSGGRYFVSALDSYAEVSPSGEGVKVFTLGAIRWSGLKKKDDVRGIEFYDSGRYFTVTGNHVAGTPTELRERGDVLSRLTAEVFPVRLSAASASLTDREVALQCLGGLSRSRAEGYDDWLRVGMALHSVSEDLLPDWDAWSRNCADKYSEGACAKKWSSFKKGGVGIGSLYHWAKQDGWVGPDRPRATNGHVGGNGVCLGEEPSLSVIPMTDIRPEPVDWLVPNYLPLGKLVLLAGDGGNGKSTITLHVAARLSRGLLPFNNALLPCGKPVSVLLVNCEDDAGDTVVPRLIAAGADFNHLGWVEGTYGQDGKVADFCMNHYLQIEKYLTTHPAVKLVIIDPCSAYVGGFDDHRDAELRSLLGPLAKLAMRTSVTMLLVKHLSKNVTLRAAHLVGGSVAWVNTCRAAFAVAANADDKAVRYFMPIKWNLGPTPPNMAYNMAPLSKDEYEPLLKAHSHLSEARRDQLGQQLFRISWDGPADVDVDQVLTSSRQRQRKDKDEEKTSEAADWLLEVLADGELTSEELIRRGKDAGFGRDTLFRAKKELNGRIKARKRGLGPWYWVLEEDCEVSSVFRDRNTSDTSGYSDGLDPFPEN